MPLSSSGHDWQRRLWRYRQRWVYAEGGLVGLPTGKVSRFHQLATYAHQTRENLRHHPLGSLELQRLISGSRARPERWLPSQPRLLLDSGPEGHFLSLPRQTLQRTNHRRLMAQLTGFAEALKQRPPGARRGPRRAPGPVRLPRPLERRLSQNGYGYGYGVYRYLAQALKVTLPHYQRRWLEQLGSGSSRPHHQNQPHLGQVLNTHRFHTAATDLQRKPTWLKPATSPGPRIYPHQQNNGTDPLQRLYRDKGAALKVRRERLGERMLASYLHSETDGVRDLGG